MHPTILKSLLALCFLLFADRSLSADEKRWRPLKDWMYHWDQGGDESISTVRATAGAWKKAEKIVTAKKAPILWLKTQLPSQLDPRSSLYLPAVIEVFEIYVDGERIYEFGDIDLKNPTISYGIPWHIIQLEPSWEGSELIFRIASPTQRIGISSGASDFGIGVGESEVILQKLLNKNFPPFIIGLVSVAVGLLLVIAGLIMREFTFTALGLFAACLGTYVFTVSKLQFLLIDAPGAWSYVNVYSVFIAPLAFISFVVRIFPDARRLLSYFFYAHGLTIFLSTALVLCDVTHIRKCQSFFNILLIFTFFAILYATVFQSFRKNANAKIFGFGYSFLLVFSIMDILVGLGLTGLPILTHWGIFLFLLCMMFIGFKQFLKQRERRIYLARSMSDAKSVQSTLIPLEKKVPGIQIASYYRSAQETGGDWFDFHHDKKADFLYVFIADVTGHGVSAALITGVVCGACKSLIHHLCTQNLRPGEVLTKLAQAVNASILETGSRTGRLTTMSLVAIDIKKGNLYSVNAGHPFTHVIGNQSIKPIVSQGSPLGLKEQPEFAAVQYKLSKGDTVFLYTDGLVENKGPSGKVLNKRSLIRKLPSLGQNPGSISAAILELGAKVWLEAEPADDYTFILLQWVGDTQGMETAG